MLEPDHPYEILDVFTDRPLAGNPLAVFTAGELIPSRLMQGVARELHLSETVFLLPGDDGADAHVRIFTPETEMPFAGHPVLGAAWVVGQRDGLVTVRLRTGAGVVAITLSREHGEIISGEMAQPIPTVASYDRVSELLEALGIGPDDLVLPVESYVNGPTHLLVALNDPAKVAALEPNMGALTGLGGVCCSCFALGGDGSVKTRMFAPAAGVREDPATGSAAGPIALHLTRHGLAPVGGSLEIIQGVEIHRPSRLIARVEGPADAPTAVLVAGSAVLVARGHFRLQ